MTHRFVPALLAAGVLAAALAAAPGASAAPTASAGQVMATTGPPARAVAAVVAARERARGTITGTVAGPGGRPLARVCVTAAGPSASATVLTRPDGRYVFTGLRPGRYSLRYSDCAAPGRYLGSEVTATTAPGQVKAMPAVTMRPASPAALMPARARTPDRADRGGTGQIRGLVTGNGHPAAGVCVQAYPLRGGDVPTTTTSADGRYALRRVPTGRYAVVFAYAVECADPGNWLSQWYKDITTPFPAQHPTVLRVTKGAILRGIDASLRRGSAFGGTVRSRSGRPLVGVCVTIYGRVRGGEFGIGLASGRGGRYAAHGLFPGTYTVGFSVGCGNNGNYAPQWWRDAATQRAAAHIKLTRPRVVTGISASLGPGSAIAGTVRGGTSAGPRLAGVCVSATDSRTGAFADARTHRDGSYRVVGLSAGTYTMRYEAACGNRGNYLSASRLVTVGTAATKRGVNVVLRLGAGFSGLVTDYSTHPLGGICVRATGPHGAGSDTYTNQDGTYSIGSLPPGRYKVEFTGGCGNTGSYLPVYYDGKPTAATADPVVLRSGQITTGINAAMQAGGSITGTVTDAAGRRLSDVCVGIASDANIVLGDYADIEFSENGSYRASNLVPGRYTVTFGCGSGRFADQWFPARPSADSARTVSVTAGQVTTGISAVMHPAGEISGTITGDAGAPLSEVCVFAVRAGHPYPVFGQDTPVSRHGQYRIGQLAAGRYDVQFQPCTASSRYASQWYRAKSTLRSATPVTVRPGRDTPGIDARLTAGATISGQVMTHAGRGAPGYCVLVENYAADSIGFALAAQSGKYSIGGLASGRYYVYANRCTGGYGAEFQRPGTVSVRAPHVLAGIDLRLPVTGSLGGTVLDEPPGSGPAANECVAVVPARTDGSYGFATTGTTGSYQVNQLAAGTYRVYFGDPYCFLADQNRAPQWYDDQPSQGKANLVTVTAGSATTGINATLGVDGTIAGTVTDQASAPVSGECVTAFPVGAAPDPLYALRPPPEVAVTGTDGRYTLAGLLPGRYQVQFTTGCGAPGYVTQWWNNAATQAAATVIAVAADSTTSGIDAALRH